MKKSKLSSFVLWSLLVLSNAVWAIYYFNLEISCGYKEGRLKQYTKNAKQLHAIIPVIKNRNATRDEVIKAAQLNNTITLNEQGDSFVQIGGLVIRFNENNMFSTIDN